ncbi:MAG: Holliday junction DNA helicase RuvB C-terminal domain-containing protein [Victivallales bacterium]
MRQKMEYTHVEVYNFSVFLLVFILIARKSAKVLNWNAIANIAAKSRGVPRILNRFLLRARDVAIYSSHTQIDSCCVVEMFDVQKIDELGLTRLDRKVLEYLGEVIRPLGISSVAQAVGEDDGTIENIVEPWLLKLRLIVKTAQGRQITELGLKHIGRSFQEMRLVG